MPKLQVCSDSDSITISGTRNSASSHSPAGRLSRYGASALPSLGRGRRVYAPWVIGKNRLFHAVSSSWLLYW